MLYKYSNGQNKTFHDGRLLKSIYFFICQTVELLRLCLHGLLHLTGHDHATNDFEKEEMLILQEQLLASYLKL